ncbi:Lrp/AsnC family transcriptional regulator [Glutamicibacter endophyticus]
MLYKLKIFRYILLHMHTLDPIDAQILLARDDDQEASLIEIANRLGLSRNTIHARLKRLRDSAALGPSSAALDPASLGKPLLAFVELSVAQQSISAVYEKMLAIPEVIEAHTTTGESDLLVRVVAQDTIDLHRITQQLQLSPGVQRSSTSIATTEVIPRRMSALLGELATTRE